MAELLTISDPKLTSPQEYHEKFFEYLQTYEFSKVVQFLQRNLSATSAEEPINRLEDEHYSFMISTQALVEYDGALAYYLLNYTALLIPILQEALLDLFEKALEHPSFPVPSSSGAGGISLKASIPKNIHIRLSSLPPVSEFVKPSIGMIRAKECNSLIQLSATIVRTGTVRMLELSKKYQCHNSRCRHSFRVYADPEQDYFIASPKYCPNMIRATSASGIGELKRCNSSTLQEIEDERKCVDYQEIKIQDRMEQLPFGTAPRSIIVILEADLVDKFNPGDDVIVIGTLIRRWRTPYPSSRCGIDLMIQANNIFSPQEPSLSSSGPHSQKGMHRIYSLELNSSMKQFEAFWRSYRSAPRPQSTVLRDRIFSSSIQERELFARNIILQSICPQLYGLFLVKLSLLMALIGGSSTSYETGVRRRSQIHLLMVGDPGCGKSQLLRFAAKLIPRSVLTTGIGTTGAGLTCSAVKEGNSNEWSLEAGALVLANGGICCIDEFSSIREADRTTIHEAMEQQTISIAKAGLVAKLPTRTTIIACCNPKGQYDLASDITVNTAIAGPLLSRFDIVLILIDQPNKDWDKAVSTHLLKRSIELGQRSNGINSNNNASNSTSTSTSNTTATPPVWDEKTLRDYLNCVKQLKPIMTEAAQQLIIRFYQMQRQNEDRSTSRTTVRLLESLVRVSEAHARLMFHPQVEIMDAVMAILCISLSGSITSVLDNALEILKEDFQFNNPNEQYERHEKRVFQLLQYSKERLWKDLEKKQKQEMEGKSNNYSEESKIFSSTTSSSDWNSNRNSFMEQVKVEEPPKKGSRSNNQSEEGSKKPIVPISIVSEEDEKDYHLNTTDSNDVEIFEIENVENLTTSSQSRQNLPNRYFNANPPSSQIKRKYGLLNKDTVSVSIQPGNQKRVKMEADDQISPKHPTTTTNTTATLPSSRPLKSILKPPSQQPLSDSSSSLLDGKTKEEDILEIMNESDQIASTFYAVNGEEQESTLKNISQERFLPNTSASVTPKTTIHSKVTHSTTTSTTATTSRRNNIFLKSAAIAKALDLQGDDIW